MKRDWRYQVPADRTIDQEYRLWVDGADTGMAVQDARSYSAVWVVLSYHGTGDSLFCVEHGLFRTLRSAKRRAEVLAPFHGQLG